MLDGGKKITLDRDKTNSLRKEEHLNISLEEDVQCKEITTGFENYYFVHQALPEIDLNEVDLSIGLFGKKLRAPLMISPMVGGIDKAEKINIRLAEVAQNMGIAMGIGSQRVVIENLKVSEVYNLREIAPDILLFSNLGAVQLNYGFGIKECKLAVDMIEADGLMLHLNPLQEALQCEGNYNFKNLLPKIKKICELLPYPVIVREVGFGISESVARNLIKIGVSGIDVGGAGGTSWAEVEKLRSQDEVLKKVAHNFRGWGIPTSDSIRMVKNCSPDILVIASGGIRSGIDAAKAIALGADLVGIALPILKNIQISVQSCIDYIREVELGLRIAMFGIGVSNISQLKNTPYLAKKGILL